MSDETTTYRYVPDTQDLREQRIADIARLMDSQWQIPGTQFRLGVDAILGLIPGIGDTISAVISSWIIYEAHQAKAPNHLKLRMAWNMFIDWLVGLIPLVGDLFDIGWKANQKNAKLLHDFIRKNPIQ